MVFLVRSTVLLLVLWGLVFVFRRNPVVRLWAIRLGLVGVVALAWGGCYLKDQEEPVVPIVAKMPAPALAQVLPFVAKPAKESAAPAPEAPLPITEPIDYLPIAWRIYGLGVVGLLAWLGLGFLQVERIRRSSTIPNCTLVEELAQSERQRPPQVLVGDRVVSPFVAGVLLPTIFLPSGWMESTSEEDQQAVLRHELAHIAHRDLAWALFHRLLCIVLWPQPLLWLLKRPMASAEEELCDRRVLASGIPDHVYADCLLRLKENLAGRRCPALGMAAVSKQSSLGSRVEAILDRRRSRAVRLGFLSGFSLLLVVVASGIGLSWAVARPPEIKPPIEWTHGLNNWSTLPELRPYEVTLSNGVQVQAGLVRKHSNFDPLDVSTLWLPNGEPYRDFTQSDLQRSLPMVGGPSRQLANGRFREDPPYGPCLELHFRDPYKERLNIRCSSLASVLIWDDSSSLIHLKTSEPVVDLRLGIGAGPFHTIQSAPFRSGSFKVRLTDMDYMYNGIHVRKQIMIEKTLPARYADKDVRVVAFDKYGRELETSQGFAPPGKAGVLAAGMLQLPSVDVIKHVEVQVRDIAWGTIRGIHLRPSHVGSSGEPSFRQVLLRNGAPIRLEAIASPISTPNKFWGPDGDALSRVRFRAPDPVLVQPGRRRVVLKTVAGPAGLSAMEVIFLLNGMAEQKGYLPQSALAPTITYLNATFPETQRVADIPMDVAAGPFKNVVTCAIGQGELKPRLAIRKAKVGPDDDLVVGVSVPARLVGSAIDLGLTTTDGMRHGSSSRGIWEPGKEQEFVFFQSSKLKVKSVTLRACPFEHVVFRNVHLYPGGH